MCCLPLLGRVFFHGQVRDVDDDVVLIQIDKPHALGIAADDRELLRLDHLLKQAGVLDGNGRLVGHHLQQPPINFGESGVSSFIDDLQDAQKLVPPANRRGQDAAGGESCFAIRRSFTPPIARALVESFTHTGDTIVLDEVLWVTAASAPPWPCEAGLATDEHGFIRVDEERDGPVGWSGAAA